MNAFTSAENCGQVRRREVMEQYPRDCQGIVVCVWRTHVLHARACVCGGLPCFEVFASRTTVSHQPAVVSVRDLCDLQHVLSRLKTTHTFEGPLLPHDMPLPQQSPYLVAAELVPSELTP